MAKLLNLPSFTTQQLPLQYFEYFLMRTLQWLKKESDASQNDLSVLKCQKLLFFTTAINCQSSVNEAILAKQIFNHFKAYQYGPVEENIYNLLKVNNNQLSHITLTFKSLELAFDAGHLNLAIADIEKESGLDSSVLNSITSSIEDLSNKNKNLVRYSPFNLVELSHRWRCWNYSYVEGIRADISWKSIAEESMIFSL
ncbi:hypothetical protein ABDJ41_08135 [Pedobacter sp. ASV1-7]|uniref:type II toxin-antitoxin system antitoxin SocA domain-containing protein n=1 Tax=Pedobacter sp. ASV1-7 TaxID=3145237 RepID=UPI0032E91FEF